MRARSITSTSVRGRPLIATALVVLAASLLAVAPAQAAPGDLDPTFSDDGRELTSIAVNDYGRGLAIQSDGKIVLVGGSYASGGTHDFALARYNPDGSLDTSFSGDGTLTTDFGGSNDAAQDVALQPDGKIVAVGDAGGDFALARYNPDGSLDPSFSGDGKQTTDFGGSSDAAHGIALQPDGKIVAVGAAGVDFGLARYNPDGSLDPSFGAGGTLTTDFGGSASGVALQPDGKIVAVGSGTGPAGSDFALARYNPDGSLDPSFGAGGTLTTDFGGSYDAYDAASDVAIQPDGKIVAVGSTSDWAISYTTSFVVARYNPDGSLDPGFGPSYLEGGFALTGFSGTDYAYGVALQPDGKIVAVGDFGGVGDFGLAGYTPDGLPDTSFSGDGVPTDFGGVDAAYGVALQPDGKIVAVGDSYDWSVPSGDFALARYEGASGPDATAPETTITGGPAGTTNDNTPTFSFSSSEPGSTFECRLDGGAFSPCSSPHSTSPLGDGSHTFYVKARDEAGNEDPTPAQQTVVVDTVAPTGTVQINNNAKRTTTLSVTLNLQATDPAPASGVTQMRIANSQSALPSASWQPYATTMPWTLTSGRGTKTVYVQYADAASNISAIAQDSITYRP